MNGGENLQSCFVDSNIWLYRFIINSHDADALLKQQIAITITNSDSLIVASAILGDAKILYSEDMHDGLIINNTLEIINPFTDLPTKKYK